MLDLFDGSSLEITRLGKKLLKIKIQHNQPTLKIQSEINYMNRLQMRNQKHISCNLQGKIYIYQKTKDKPCFIFNKWMDRLKAGNHILMWRKSERRRSVIDCLINRLWRHGEKHGQKVILLQEKTIWSIFLQVFSLKQTS